MFNSFTYNFKEGDDNNNLLKTPKHEIFIDEALQMEFRDAYQKVWDEIYSMKAPVIINSKNYSSRERHGETIQSRSYDNWGILQNICIVK